VRHQIREMAAQGVRGFYIHPRQGLGQPYMSLAFFAMVEAAVDEAERHGLAVHLYDEYPYPSGVAGGEVILGNPHFQATRLVQRTYDVDGGPVRLSLPHGRVLTCVAHPVAGETVRWDAPLDLRAHVGMVLGTESYSETGLTQYNRKRYFAGEPSPVLEADLPLAPHRIYVSVQAVVEGHKYWGQFVDVLNEAAVREFMRLTHERYAAHLGRHFGGAIRSIFTDETAPGWSELLPAAFAERFGYDLLPLLPALQDWSHPEHLRVAADLHRLRYELFCTGFEAPLSAWCREHGIRYAGEKPVLRLAQLRFSDVPGCDPGHTKAGRALDLLEPSIRKNARAVASAAYFYDKPGALCECYHSLGWSATLQDAKLIAEGLLLLGVDHLVPHAFFYSTHALKKHDAPPSFFLQMPHWAMFGHLSARVDRIAAAFAGTHIDAAVLVLDPAGGLPERQDLATYRRVLHLLAEAHIEFHVVDTDILESAVFASEPAGTRVCVRDVRAAVVVVPPMRVVEPELAAWCDRAARAGVVVLRPEADFDEAALAARLAREAAPALRLSAATGDTRGVWMVARRDGDRRVWLLLNTGGEAVDIHLKAGGPLREIPLDPALPPRLHTEDASYRRYLQPFESLMVESAGAAPATAERPAAIVPIVPGGPLELHADRDNLLRLGEWELTVEDGSGVADGPRTVHAAPAPNQLAEGGFRIRPAVTERFGLDPDIRLPALTLQYAAEFDLDYDGPVALLVEPGSIAGRWRIVVNGTECIGPESLRPTDAHVRGSLATDITPHLRRGCNRLVVRVETGRLDGGLVNPLYLAGAFGVKLCPPRLVPRPAAAGFEAWEANGLPHYAGVVEYRWGFDLTEGDAARAAEGRALGELRLPGPFEDACEVSINGGAWRAALWSPRLVPLGPGDVHSGSNRISVRVYTTLIRAFEGQRFDPVEHRYVPV